jgi:hypothetical protein
MVMKRAAERRWALIAEDGRPSWLGRHSDSSEAELAQVTDSLAKQGIAGWLAVTEGVYYGRGKFSVLMVRPHCGEANWETSVAAFQEHRRQGLVTRS